jgi:hypothetical protein
LESGKSTSFLQTLTNINGRNGDRCEGGMNELRVAQIIAISFSILWAFSLGLNFFG